jgi:hypothetical protein
MHEMGGKFWIVTKVAANSMDVRENFFLVGSFFSEKKQQFLTLSFKILEPAQ